MKRDEPCRWRNVSNEIEDYWETECGEAHLFEAGGPIENKHRFCPYCGKRLREMKTRHQ